MATVFNPFTGKLDYTLNDSDYLPSDEDVVIEDDLTVSGTINNDEAKRYALMVG
jgi:hypothetical protein